MRVLSTPMERAAAFSALLVAIYALPLLLSVPGDAWEFISHWDDEENFVDNAVIQAPLSAESLRAMWTMGRINVYEPLGWMLKALVCQFVGLNSWWVRVVTLALHVAACAVLARASAMLLELLEVLQTPASRVHLAKRSSRQWTASCVISAALFAVHPVHVQVVGWPSAQPYALAALFANLAICAYLQPIHKATLELSRAGRQERDQRQRVRSSQVLDVIAGQADTWSRTLVVTGLYVCALLSKSIAIFTPAAFVLIDVLLVMKANGAAPSSTPAPETNSTGSVGLASSRELAPPMLRLLASYVLHKFPLVLAFAELATATIWFNRHGSDNDTDVLVLTIYERVVKALSAPAAVAQLVLWPARLRPHYLQVESQYSDVWRPDNLLPVAGLVLLAWAAIYQCHPSVNAPQHALGLAYFVLTLLPVCGLIQHGLVSGLADRYAYMGTITLVPYGGAILSRWLFPGGSSVGDKEDGEVVSRDHPESTTPVRVQDAPPRVAVAACSTGPRGVHRWAIVVAVAGTLLRISTQFMATWRTEETLYTYAFQMDPFDWRELDSLASMYNGRGECLRDWERCRKLWERSYANAPTSSIKAQLYLLRTRIILGGAAVIPDVCAAYERLAAEYPNQPLLVNNLGVCQSRSGQHDKARELFVLALELTEVEGYRATIQKNIAVFDEWHRHRTATSDEPEGTESLNDVGYSAELVY